MKNFHFESERAAPKKQAEIIASFQINLVLSPWWSKTTRKTKLLIEKYKQCLLQQITTKLLQITSALLIIKYDKVLLQITTAFFL